MAGIEKIIDAIIEQAKAEAEEIISRARATAEEIINEAQERSSNDCAVIFDRARKEATLSEHINRSNAQSLSRKKLLSVRQEIIDSVISKALDKLRSLPDREYFDVLAGLCTRYAMSGSGELVLSDKDKNRLPSDFMDRINASLSGDRTLTLCSDNANIDGGFILRYGGIEENCSFEALAEEKLDDISDMLQTMLFD